MFLRSISFLIILLFFISCSSEPKKEETTSVLPAKNLISEIDTFYGGTNLITLSDTTQSFFDSHYRNFSDTSEMKNIKPDENLVQRVGDTLKIKINSNETKTYVNTKTDNEDYANYFYMGKIKGLNYFVVYVSMMESYTYLIINSNTGKETFACGVPEVSPDKTKIICGSFDLQAAFVYNGLQMYQVGADSLKPLWFRELTKWGANDLAWVDNTTLAAKRMYLDSKQNTLTSYLKISNCK